MTRRGAAGGAVDAMALAVDGLQTAPRATTAGQPAVSTAKVVHQTGSVSEFTDSASTGQWLVLEDFPSAALTRTLSPNGRAHWAAKSKAADVVRNAVWLAVLEHGTRPVPPPVRITYRWVFPDHRRRDVDNYSTGVVKVIQDRLVSLGILAGDHAAVLSMTVEIVVQKYRRAIEIHLAPAAREA